jgi:hypothetical protein
MYGSLPAIAARLKSNFALREAVGQVSETNLGHDLQMPT